MKPLNKRPFQLKEACIRVQMQNVSKTDLTDYIFCDHIKRHKLLLESKSFSRFFFLLKIIFLSLLVANCETVFLSKYSFFLVLTLNSYLFLQSGLSLYLTLSPIFLKSSLFVSLSLCLSVSLSLCLSVSLSLCIPVLQSEFISTSLILLHIDQFNLAAYEPV